MADISVQIVRYIAIDNKYKQITIVAIIPSLVYVWCIKLSYFS